MCRLFMYLNDQQVEESFFLSGYENNVDAYDYDQGSRTMVSHTNFKTKSMKLPAQIFHMNEGDTLHIEADRASDKDYFSDMTFCITLTTWDY